MNVNVYLPDDLGRRAKEGQLPLSRLLQQAVRDELERRAVITTSLTGAQTIEVELEDSDGRGYTGRLEGVCLVEGRHGPVVYVTVDERVIVIDTRRSTYEELDDPVQDLRDWLDEDEYVEAMNGLGEKPVIDL